MDVVAVVRAMTDAVEIIRDGRGPVVIEAKCYRHFHQRGGSKTGSEFGYRRHARKSRNGFKRDPLAPG